ncbi:MAG: restriction modification system DNA specificity protein [uncultured bacterium]|nr:MAG: restriction modification system DNA specificity protein [uncultured bacterium]
MSSDSYRLDSLLEITSSKRIHMADYVPSGVPFYRGKEVIERAKGNSVSTELFITHTQYQEIKRKFGSPQDGDVLLTSVGTLGVAYFIDGDGDFYFKDGNVTWFRNFDPRVVPKYLYYWLTSPKTQKRLDEVSIGSTQRALTISALKSLQVQLPSVDSQRAIVDMLDAVTNRITLLRETNATLEAIAQALFKSWFVDFDPVRAKMEGRPPEGMDEATAALFPDGFETSELGEVPRGWRVGSVYDISKVVYGAPFASKLFKAAPPGRPLVRIRDLKDERPGVFTEEVHPKGYLLKPGDIAVGMDGEFRAYVWGGETAWLNQRVCVFHPINGASSAFVRLSIAPLLAAVEASETATTVIHLGKNDIDRFRVILPSSTVLHAFRAVAKPVYERLVLNKQKAQTLSTLRDTLLPRLISGQLRLPEAQAALETTP